MWRYIKNFPQNLDLKDGALWSESKTKRGVCSDTACCQQSTLSPAACLAVQPGLQLARLAVAHRRSRQDLLPRHFTLPSTVGHQERVLFEADGLRVYQTFLFFFFLSGWMDGRWWAGTVSDGVQTGGELGSVMMILMIVWAGFGVQVAEGLWAMS